MWRIESRLYLGDYSSARAALLGAELPVEPEGVTRPIAGVISLCDVPLYPEDEVLRPTQPTTEWLLVPIQDGGNGEFEFEGALGVALPFARRQLERGNLLVHCAAGMSRSVSIIAALLCERGHSVDAAFTAIAAAKARALGIHPDDAKHLIAPAWEFRSALERLYEAKG